METIDPASKGLKEEIVAFFQAVATRQAAFVKSWQELTGFEAFRIATFTRPKAFLRAIEERLDKLIRGYEQSQNPEQRKALEQRRADLMAGKQLSENIQDYSDPPPATDYSIQAQAVQSCLRHYGNFQEELRKMRRLFITQEFEERLAQEVKEFRLEHLPFKIHERSDRGVSFLGVDLDIVQRLQNKDILSDGEFRALALACFLTEVNTIPHHSGIILDDPVSSLDHVRTRPGGHAVGA